MISDTMRWRLYYAENQEQQVIISILFCETLSVLMFCVLFSPFERTGRCDNLVCCTGGRMRVTLTAGVHGEMSRLQKTQNFRNIGAKKTQDYDNMRGELSKCFPDFRLLKLHSCFYWKMMVMGHHRKSKILFIFLPSYSWSWSKSTVPSDASNKQLDDDFWMSRASQ